MNRIKELREERGLSQRAVAVGMGTSDANVSRWENGRAEMTAPFIILVAKYFGVTAGYILGIEDEDGHPIVESEI